MKADFQLCVYVCVVDSVETMRRRPILMNIMETCRKERTSASDHAVQHEAAQSLSTNSVLFTVSAPLTGVCPGAEWTARNGPVRLYDRLDSRQLRG